MKFYDCSTAPSPRRARIFLAEKQVSYEAINVDLMSGEQMSDSFRAINPSCTVPVLELDDGTYLTENSAIAAYLEAEYPDPPLFGRSATEKAMVAGWTTQIEMQGMWAIAEALRNASPAFKNRALTGEANYQQIPELAERGMARLKLFFDKLDAQLEGREYVAIDTFSNADITAVVTVDFARIVKVQPQENHKNIIRWRQQLSERPSLSL